VHVLFIRVLENHASGSKQFNSAVDSKQAGRKVWVFGACGCMFIKRRIAGVGQAWALMIVLPWQTFLCFARAGRRHIPGFLFPGSHWVAQFYVCGLVFAHAHAVWLHQRNLTTRCPARRTCRHEATGWAALGADDGLALATCLRRALWRTWRHISWPRNRSIDCSSWCFESVKQFLHRSSWSRVVGRKKRNPH